MDNCDCNAAGAPCEKGWLGRNWKWFLPVFCVLLMVVAVGLFAKFVGKGALMEVYRAYRADGVIKTSEPFRLALQQLQADPEVMERLGEPVEATDYASGSVDVFCEDGVETGGNANFYFDLAGPKGTASVACQGKMVDGRWGLSMLTATFDDGKRHLLKISGADDGLDEAPAWTP